MAMALRCAAAAILPSPRPRVARRRHHHHHHHHHVLPHSAFLQQARRLTSGAPLWTCGSRRRARYEEEGEDEEEYGHNEDMAQLERYSEGARDQAFLVNASVDGEVESVLVFKGFSSSLSGRTAADPAMSVLPERAVIQSVDVVIGPFDPDNIEYLEKDVAWDEFKGRLQ